MKTLPYTAATETGDKFDINFPLHDETSDAVKVHNLISSLLSAIESDIKLSNGMDNGDVLQAMAMALAIRARMIHAPHEVTAQIALDLLSTAVNAAGKALHDRAEAGTA